MTSPKRPASPTQPSTPRLSEAARHFVLPKGIVSTGFPSVRATCLKLKIVFDPVNYYNIIESGGGSVATLIVSKFGEASGPYETQLLLAAGFFLFMMTLLVNVIANLIVNRTGRLKK